MIKARHISFYVNFINLYTKLNIQWHFSKVTINSNIKVQPLPVLLIGNHSTWWDGFFGAYLNIKIFRKIIYVMMLEEQLIHRKFLNKAGAYSIQKGARSMIETINYSKNILNNKNNLLLMFPQGEIQSSYTYPLKFEKGIMQLIKTEHPIQLVFFAALIDYFSNKKPQLNFYLTEHNILNITTINDIENAYNQFFKNCIESQKE